MSADGVNLSADIFMGWETFLKFIAANLQDLFG